MPKVKKTHRMPDGTIMAGATHPKALIKKLKDKKGISSPQKGAY